jgi:nitroimidazol reductase NimA-like FMN-containing flavoprotein (pyridoxamine 5'-phosphate oxidase superfamily)
VRVAGAVFSLASLHREMARESTALDEAERREFLGTGGTGVVALASPAEESPYAVPVSYGHDPVESVFYFRLAVGGDSGKGELDGRPVTFVAHGERDGRHHSVVASGRLERTDEASIATETLSGLGRVEIPLFDVFGRPPGDVKFGFYRLVPEQVTGLVESSTAP